MAELNRYQMVGKYEFVGTGLVKDHTTGEIHNGKITFSSFSPAVETSSDGNRRTAKMNLELVRSHDSDSMWEMIVLDNEEDSTNQEIVIDDEEMVAFISDGIAQINRNLTKMEMIHAVLDLEFEFLKSKGVIEG